MNGFEDQIFGEEFAIVDATPDISSGSPFSPSGDQCAGESGDVQGHEDNPLTGVRKFRIAKRQISFDMQIGFNQKSVTGRSFTTTQDNSQYYDCENSLTHRNRTNHLHLKQLKAQNVMQCPLCHGQKGMASCFACKGKGNVTGADNFSKFFEYVMQFKLGSKGPYDNRKLREQQQPPINQFCGDFFQSQQLTKGARYTIGARASITQSINKSEFNFKDFRNKIEDKMNVHCGFECDGCQINPIVGPRYHCEHIQCNTDFDLCEACYQRCGHRHQMKQISIKNKTIQKLQILEKILGKGGKKGMLGIPVTGSRVFHSSIH